MLLQVDLFSHKRFWRKSPPVKPISSCSFSSKQKSTTLDDKSEVVFQTISFCLPRDIPITPLTSSQFIIAAFQNSPETGDQHTCSPVNKRLLACSIFSSTDKNWKPLPISRVFSRNSLVYEAITEIYVMAVSRYGSKKLKILKRESLSKRNLRDGSKSKHTVRIRKIV